MADSNINDINKTKPKTTFGKEFEGYYTLFHNLFFNFLQVSITLLLFVGILNLSKENADQLYPVDLRSKFYGDGSCHLGKMKPGETAFCDSYTLLENEVFNKALSGESMFAPKVETYAKNNGYVSSDSFSLFLLWVSYLAFSCEHFTQVLLNSMQKIVKSLYDSYFIVKFLIIITIFSVVNNINTKYVTPFFTKLFNRRGKYNVDPKKNILLGIANELFISFICIFVLIFAFFMVPLTIYYVVAICFLLSENLSIQMNILCVFSLFLTIKALTLFVTFMQGQFGKNSIRRQSGGKRGSDAGIAVLNAGIQNQKEFKNFLTSYILFFIIPIVVGFSKMFKLIVSLSSNLNPFSLHNHYKITFVSILLISFYYTIKKDLDGLYNFPYSLIYAVLSFFTIMYILYSNK